MSTDVLGNPVTLDSKAALGALNECCNSPERSWSARELMAKLDEITGTQVFRELYDMHVASKEFPELAATYRALGILSGVGGIELSGDERDRRLRDAIMETGVLAIGEVPAQ